MTTRLKFLLIALVIALAMWAVIITTGKWLLRDGPQVDGVIHQTVPQSPQ